MFRNTSLEVRAWTSFFSVSTPAPRLPITMPGRAVKMLIFTLFAARSTSTEETPACPSFCLTNFLRCRSSCSHFEKSFSEYHFELHPRMTPSRNPTGCVFCPIGEPLSLFRDVDDDGDVRGAADDAVGAAHGPRHPGLVRRTAVDEHLRD